MWLVLMSGRGLYRVLMAKHGGKRPLVDLGVDGRLILKGSFKKWDGRHGLDGYATSYCENAKETSISL